MLIKKPKKQLYKTFFKIGKGFLLFELALAGGCYVVWSRMNRSQDFRHYMSENWPSILESYYSIGETISSENKKIREYDLLTWANSKS